MVYVPALNTLQLELRGTQSGQAVENVLYFNRASAMSESDVEDLFDFFEDTWIPDMVSELADNFGYTELYGTDLTTSTSPTYSRVFAAPIVGAIGSAVMPGSVATCLSFRTNARGRGARGRNYIAGVTEGDVTGNNLNATRVNNQIAVYETLMGTGVTSLGWNWVQISRILDGVARVAALIRNIIDIVSTDLVVDSQRGRLRT